MQGQRHSPGTRISIGILAALCLASAADAQTEDSRLCAGCHRGIWETFRRTGMGRSFRRAVEDFGGDAAYYHQASDSYFAMVHRDGKVYQRRYQLDSSGRQVNVLEKQIDYVLGSGNHSRAYLHRNPDNTLIELPLAWYAEKGGYWAMNPGYDRPDHDGFRRQIGYDCMFCHNAYPEIPAGHDRPFSPPVYRGALPEGIDCQRCHGAGNRHAALAAAPGAAREQIRNAVVNPARFPAERQIELCMVCHLETTSFPLPNAIQRYDRGPVSYRPGEPLGDFILNFDHAPGTGREDKFEIVNAAYRMRRSACFLKSNGALRCTTCHDPHSAPRGEAATRHYTAVCRQCHGASVDRQVAAGRHSAASDCVNCHMPKRRTEDVVHVVATDHRIQRRKPDGDLLADRPERHETGRDAYRGPVVLYYPEALPPTPENELYLAVAQVKQGSNLKQGIAQLSAALVQHKPARPEFYLELGDALESNGQPAAAVPWFREAVRRSSDSAVAVEKLGAALRRSGQNAEAAQTLERAAALDPLMAVTWHELGLSDRALGKAVESAAALRRAIDLDPDFPEAHNNLGILQLSAGQAAEAESEFREAIRIRPDYADAHGNLANLLLAAGRFDAAANHFRSALRFRPDDAPTRYNYALLLGRTRRIEEARRELEAALRADPEFAAAHERLGALLVAAGDTKGAIPHLEKAAAASDVATRERALELLRQLGQRR